MCYNKKTKQTSVLKIIKGVGIQVIKSCEMANSITKYLCGKSLRWRTKSCEISNLYVVIANSITT